MCNIITAYPYNDYTAETLYAHAGKRFESLDPEVNAGKFVNVLFDNIYKKEEVSSRIIPAVRPFVKYLKEEKMIEQMEPLVLSRLFAILGKVGITTHVKFDLTNKVMAHLHQNLNELQESSVLFCLDGLNSVLTYSRKQQSRTDPDALKFAKELNQLVIEMALANSELVDLFFLTRYLSKLAQFKELKHILAR